MPNKKEINDETKKEPLIISKTNFFMIKITFHILMKILYKELLIIHQEEVDGVVLLEQDLVL